MKPVPTIGVLRLARSLIADPGFWTQGAFARDAQDHMVNVYDGDACRFCLLGAIRWGMYRCGLSASLDNEIGRPELLASMNRLAVRHGHRYASDANDDGGHAVALAILDDAIRELEEQS